MTWARKLLHASPGNIIITLAVLWALWQAVPPLVEWAFVGATWFADSPDACRRGTGACWAVITSKHRFLLFGLYPYDEQWRALLASALMLALVALTCNRRLWDRRLVVAWLAVLGLAFLLMRGGAFGLRYVPAEQWGGLPLTLVLSVVAIGGAFPLAIVLALGRRSRLPVIRAMSVTYIEIVRGVPLVSVLFMASVMFPLFLPEGVTIDKVLRAQIGFILFTAAYLAEAVRGGLQSVPKGQYEAADALGLSTVQKLRLVILPQALRASIPPVVNQFIAMFKDTSLVVIIGLYDLLTTTRIALTDPPWRPYYVEAYIGAGLIYFVFCFALSRASLRLERSLNAGVRV
ncbi:MAG: amino acid ABC transporter permease [Gemmatimonas sp.]